ncbi:ATP-binding cassette domain-containing protein [Gottschalkia purinilytica]|nr:ATP-binding cassette domain-containing protein [Gottschalkia purinilytica]
MVYSFNNPQGMCPLCKGLGETKRINIRKLIDFDKSLNEGAIKFPTFQPGGWRLTRYTETGNFDNNKKISDYSKDELNLLLYDTGSKPKNPTKDWPKTSTYIGVIPRITKSFIDKEDSQYASDLDYILEVQHCPECNGTRVNDVVRSAKIKGKSIADCVTMSITELLDFVESINNSSVEIVLKDLVKKLESLQTVGLNYLSLNRSTSTLSGGESQRIKMTKHLNSSLSDVLYIFDEPSVGLHPEDIVGINKIMKGLKHKGNTVILVDHDPDIIKIADYIINIGELAGANGGYVTFEGSYKELLTSDTITGKTLSRTHSLNQEKIEFTSFYTLNNVSLYNIKNASVKIPKNALTVVTGVAGSGKSTLIRYLFKEKYSQAKLLDQSPIRGSNRSNILTYLNVFDNIREIFAKLSHKNRSLFSYNSKGACPVCKGKGYIKLDLAYMGDIEQTCEKCNGKRYSDEALSFKWHGKNIYDILQLTVGEAKDLFDDYQINRAIQSLIDVNLSYIKLGQSLDTFSGGELQRLKIAKIIHENENNLLILDEPSTGLHEADIDNLLSLFYKLLEKGSTLIILEHNLSIISQAHWIIDMGLQGGSLGGKVIFQGYPVDLVGSTKSYTAKHLRNYIG